MPLVTAPHGGEGLVAGVGKGAVGWIGPRDHDVEESDDFPLGKELLHLLGVGELEGLQEQALGCERGRHGDNDSKICF